MFKYRKIPQLKDVAYEVKANAQYDYIQEHPELEGTPIAHFIKLPTITFEGTVKIHGTNASWHYNKASDTITPQSRNRELTVESDNAGFAAFSIDNFHYIDSLVANFSDYEYDDLIIYGEWCGPGIQSGVAVSQLPERTFVIFSIKLVKDDVTTYVKPSDENIPSNVKNILSIHYFKDFSVTIDFNEPYAEINNIIEMTKSVEDLCPVGDKLGYKGIGEGIVFTSPDGRYIFKSKGEKHSVSKVKKLTPIDVDAIKALSEFASQYCTENRMEQGVEYLKEMQIEVSVKSFGAFLKWLNTDIITEEKLAIEESGYTNSQVAKSVVKIAKPWYFNKIYDM